MRTSNCDLEGPRIARLEGETTGYSVLCQTNQLHVKTKDNGALNFWSNFSDVNAALGLKENKSTTCTKAQVDDALNLESNVADAKIALRLSSDECHADAKLNFKAEK